MNVEVRAFATLAAFLPPDSQHGSTLIDLPCGSTLADVAPSLGIPAELQVVALVNGQDVEPSYSLAPGDVVTLFPPLAGGSHSALESPVTLP